MSVLPLDHLGSRTRIPLWRWCQSEARQIAIVSDHNVAIYYGHVLEQQLSMHGLACFSLTFSAGERFKTRETKQHLEDQLLERHCQRDTAIIAFGGGVVLDLAGFLAATYYRGVAIAYVPTTLLAMVDACVGGKTGVNTVYGKNTLGVIRHPQQVFIETAFLETLPAVEWLAGWVEMMKHGLIVSAGFLEQLWSARESLYQRHIAGMDALVEHSLRIKEAIISQDQEQSGLRHILNFGHTFGHAIEVCSGYAVSHGRAVAWGLWLESLASHYRGLLCRDDLNRIRYYLDKFGLLADLCQYGLTRHGIKLALHYDKKNQGRQWHCVLLASIGEVQPSKESWLHALTEAEVDAVLNELPI